MTPSRVQFAKLQSFWIVTLLFGFLCIFGKADAVITATTVPQACAGASVSTSLNANLIFGSIGSGSLGLGGTLGWFAQRNLTMCYVNVANSTDLYQGIRDGYFDGTTAQFDNAVNRVVNGILPLTVLSGTGLGGGQGLMGSTINGVRSIQDLLNLAKPNGQGFNLAVDAPDSGLVYGVKKALSVYGLYEPDNYTLVIIGGTPIRTVAVSNGAGINTNTGVMEIIHCSSLPVSSANTKISTVLTVSDFISPLASTATQVLQSVPNNPQKRASLVKLLEIQILAQRFYANARNRAFLLNLAGGGPTASAAAQASALANYNSFFDPVNGQITPQNDVVINRQAALNVFYIRQQFHGFDSSPNGGSTLNMEQFVEPGPGKLIDYTLQQAALANANASQTVNGSLPNNVAFQQLPSQPNQLFTFPNLVQSTSQYFSGGCTGAPIVEVGAVSVSTEAALLSDFRYDANTDTLYLQSHTDTRTYTVTYNVFEACDANPKLVVHQQYLIQSNSTTNPYNNLQRNGAHFISKWKSDSLLLLLLLLCLHAYVISS